MPELVLHDVVADRREVRRPRGAVDERDPVQQEPGRERAKQEVLERGLRRARAATVHAREHVHGDRHHLDAEEHDHEVARGGHDHHAGRREQHEHVRFGAPDSLAPVVLDAERDRAEGGENEQRIGGEAESVDGNHA